MTDIYIIWKGKNSRLSILLLSKFWGVEIHSANLYFIHDATVNSQTLNIASTYIFNFRLLLITPYMEKSGVSDSDKKELENCIFYAMNKLLVEPNFMGIFLVSLFLVI